MSKLAYWDKRDIHSRAPVDKQAARVVFFGGEHWDHKKKITCISQATPLQIKRVRPNEPDLTGIKFGRFVVLGALAQKAGANGRAWVVRCECGTYETRRAKAIRNPNNALDRCQHCRELAHVKRSYIHDKTGKDLTWDQL